MVVPLPGEHPLLAIAAEPPIEPPSGDSLAAKYSALASDRNSTEALKAAASLFAGAEGHLFNREFNESLEQSLQSLERFRALAHGTGQADALRLVCHCLRSHGKKELAVQRAEQDLARFHGDKLGRGKILLSLAESGAKQPDCNNRDGVEGIVFCRVNDALDIFRQCQDRLFEGIALLTLADIQLKELKGSQKSRAWRSKETAKQAATIFSELGHARGLVRSMYRLGTACAFGGDTEGALHAAEQAFVAAQQLQDQRLEAFLLQCRASWNLTGEDPSEALPDAMRALALVRKLDAGSLSEASASRTLVCAHFAHKQVAEALQVAKQGFQLLQRPTDRFAEALVLETLVYAHIANNDTDDALSYAQRARAAYRSDAEWHRESLMLRTIVSLQLQALDVHSAAMSVSDALSLGEELNASWEQGSAWLQLAYVRQANGDLAGAITAAEQAEALFQHGCDSRGEGVALLAVASAQATLGDTRAVASEASRALNRFQEAGDARGKAQSLTVLCEAQAADGDFDAALQTAALARDSWEDLYEGPAQAPVLVAAAHACIEQAYVGMPKEPQSVSDQQVAEALSYSGEAVAACREDEEANKELLAQSLSMLAQAMLLDGRPDEALENLEEALSLFREAKDLTCEAETLCIASRTHTMRRNNEEARLAANDACELCRQLGDRQLEAQAMALLRACGGLSESEQASLWAVQSTSNQPALKAKSTAATVAQNVKPPEALSQMNTFGGIHTNLVLDRVRTLSESLGLEDIEVDVGLMQSGLTSSMAIQLTTLLASDYPSVKLPSTLIFDYPSLIDVAQFINSAIEPDSVD